MGNKDLGNTEKVVNRVFAATQPYKQAAVERFVREYVTPYARKSKIFAKIREWVGEENFSRFGNTVPGAMSFVLNELPDSMFITREVGDTVRLLVTTFFMELNKGLRGIDAATLPDEMAAKVDAAEKAALDAIQTVLEQDVYYDRTGYWHFAACPNWQGGNNRNVPKAKLRDALELRRQPATCCRTHAEETTDKAKADETVKAAPKSYPRTVIPAGASIADVFGTLLLSANPGDRAVGQRLSDWLNTLPKARRIKAAKLLQELDSIEEAYALDNAVGDGQKFFQLRLMKSRHKAQKNKLSEFKAEVKDSFTKAVAEVKGSLHRLDEKVVSDATLKKQSARIQTLQAERDARRAKNAPRFANLWGLL